MTLWLDKKEVAGEHLSGLISPGGRWTDRKTDEWESERLTGHPLPKAQRRSDFYTWVNIQTDQGAKEFSNQETWRWRIRGVNSPQEHRAIWRVKFIFPVWMGEGVLEIQEGQRGQKVGQGLREGIWIRSGEDRRSDIKGERREIIWSETGCSQIGNTTSASYLTHVLALELISVTDVKLFFSQFKRLGFI